MMTDTFAPADRSALMGRVRSSGTRPERVVRSYLHRAGLRFGSNRGLTGKPDVVLPRWRTILFVNGCFWHGHEACRRGRPVKSNTEWWRAKIARNRERDARVQADLRTAGWRVFCVWECVDLKPDRLDALVASIRDTQPVGSIPQSSGHV